MSSGAHGYIHRVTTARPFGQRSGAVIMKDEFLDAAELDRPLHLSLDHVLCDRPAIGPGEYKPVNVQNDCARFLLRADLLEDLASSWRERRDLLGSGFLSAAFRNNYAEFDINLVISISRSRSPWLKHVSAANSESLAIHIG